MRAIQGEPIDFLQTEFVAKDGRVVPVEGSVTSRFLGDTVVATHGFFRDITERLHARELEERTVKLEREERARYLEKMAALGKLSAGLAHELNNPAAAVQRANAGLQETLRRRDATMRALGDACLDPAAWQAMESLLADARSRERPSDPIAVSDAEETLETWLEDHAIDRAWEMAPALAEAGIAAGDLTAIEGQLPAAALPAAIRWLNETLLLGESTRSSARAAVASPIWCRRSRAIRTWTAPPSTRPISTKAWRIPSSSSRTVSATLRSSASMTARSRRSGCTVIPSIRSGPTFSTTPSMR
jgi:hypothetical protein